MSSQFFKDVRGKYFGGDGAGAILRKSFQCSPAMATCDGMYPPPQEKDTEQEKQEKQENEKPSVLPSPHPEHDEEQETYLRMREMKKMQEGAAAMKKVMNEDGILARGGGGGGGLGHNGCDMTGEEFMIVCEELWVDFKFWANRHENMSFSFTKLRNFVARYYAFMILTATFFIWFRWYIGSGKNACDQGFGTGILNFICEVARNLGEIIVGIILGVGVFCTGLLPILLVVCVYEVKNMDSSRQDMYYDDDHEKKE